MEKFESWGEHSVSTIVSDRFLTVVADNQYLTISSENERFDIAKEALRNKNFDALIEALKPIELVKRVGVKMGSFVRVEEDAVYYNEEPLHGVLVNRILEFAREGYDYEPLVLFLENLQENPSRTVINELYEWLENAETPMPITEDGHFLAYKKVRANFHDVHSGRLDYSVGNVVEEARNTVDDNRNNTCSNGLHFCSLGYLRGFGGAITVILKINPRDVVAFPQDSNTSKGRCCRVEVIGIHDKGDHVPAWEDRGYVNTHDEYEDYYDEDENDDWDTGDSSADESEAPVFANVLHYYTRKEARIRSCMHGGRVVDTETYAFAPYRRGSAYRWAVVD